MTPSTGGSALYRHTAASFGRSAPLYDKEHAANALARWTRRRSLAVLDRAFGPGDRVIELGSGTGAEAIHLAIRGVEVLATDISEGMIEQLEAKLGPGASGAAVRERITTRVLPAGRAGQLVEEFGKGYFDGAYSSFGALNCEPSFAPVAAALAALVRPGGRLVLSLINRYCPWETAWYLLHRRPRQAFRRWSGQAAATVRGEWQNLRVPVFYWTPAEVERAFAPHFRPLRRTALTWLLPPQYLDGLLRRAPRLWRLVARVERRTAALWPLYALGDHFLLELEREA